MKRLFLYGLIIFAALSTCSLSNRQSYATNGYEHNTNPMFDSISNMTAQELVAEMKYAVLMKNQGKYYPEDRIKAIESQIAVVQQQEIARYQAQLKNEAEVAKQIEQLKQKAIDEANKQGADYYEKHKAEIQARVEEEARKMLNMSETDWAVNKEMYTKMYQDGAKLYEEHAQGYVDAAKKALDAYNAYQQAKADNPYAPEAAQNLLGFLNATKEVLTFAGEKMQDTPLRPIGEILKAYGEAASLGDAAKNAAWNYVNREGINPLVPTQYSDGFNQIGLQDATLTYKSDLMKFDNSMNVLYLGNSRYAAFDDKFKPIPGSSGLTMTEAEYKKLEQLYVAYQNGKQEGWPKLTIDQMMQLVRGENISLKIKGGFLESDKTKELSPKDIMDMGHMNMNDVIKDDIFRSVDRILNGEASVIGNLIDSVLGNNRMKEIYDAYIKYLETREDSPEMSGIHMKESFLELVKKLKDENPNLTMADIMKYLQDQIDKKKGTESGAGDSKANPLDETIKNIDPSITSANSAGIAMGGAAGQGGHWTALSPEGFNGRTDSGFTQIGTTHRPMPDTVKLSIPVLKPNIYLYPEQVKKVAVTFGSPERLTKTIPEYTDGWSVSAAPDGLLDGSYGYLFYEADVETMYFQKAEAWSIPVADRSEALESILDKYGFNRKEKDDFIQFWNEKLDSGKEYLAYPQETWRIDKAMPVEISSDPDSIFRLWFYFTPDVRTPHLAPHEIETIDRNGFTVVEWGGMVEQSLE
jgi:hypothetical protein